MKLQATFASLSYSEIESRDVNMFLRERARDRFAIKAAALVKGFFFSCAARARKDVQRVGLRGYMRVCVCLREKRLAEFAK